MRRWCLIEEFATFEKVKFYTVRFEDEDLSETDKFFSAFEADSNKQKELNHLLTFLKLLGDKFGANSDFFRHEGLVDGLPPKEKIAKRFGLVEFIEYDFRLYCMRLSDNIVILFNGVIKTTNKNQDDPQLMSTFRMATTFGRRINEKINDKEFTWQGRNLIADELAFEY